MLNYKSKESCAFDALSLGEIMLRLSTPGNTRFVQSDSFDVVYGGGESEVELYAHEQVFLAPHVEHVVQSLGEVVECKTDEREEFLVKLVVARSRYLAQDIIAYT